MAFSAISPLWSIMGESISIVWWMSWIVSAGDVMRFCNFKDFVVCIKHLLSKPNQWGLQWMLEAKLVYLLHQSRIKASSLAYSKWCTNTKHILQFIFDSSETAGDPSYCKFLEIFRICLFCGLVVNSIKFKINLEMITACHLRHSLQIQNGEWDSEMPKVEGNPVSI